MASHDPEHEALLVEALAAAGPAAALPPPLRACGHCAERYRELAGLTGGLAAAAAWERSGLDEAGGVAVPEGDALVAAFLAEQAPPPPPAIGERRPTGWRAFLPALAAAALAAGLLALFAARARPPASERGPVLGHGAPPAAGGLWPEGAVASFAEPFRWDLPTSGWFVVRVYDERDDAPLATSQRLFEPTWRVDPAATERWPDRIRWEVQAFDATGVPRGAAEAAARRAAR